MRTARRTRSLKAALVGVGVASMMSSSLPAYADTLTVTFLNCEPRYYGMWCEAYVSGGTGGNTYTWNQPTVMRSDGPSSSIIAIACEGSRFVTFTVKDSSNATASATIYHNCGGNP